MNNSSKLVGISRESRTVTKGDAVLFHPNIPPQPPASSKPAPTPSKPSAAPTPTKNAK